MKNISLANIISVVMIMLSVMGTGFLESYNRGRQAENLRSVLTTIQKSLVSNRLTIDKNSSDISNLANTVVKPMGLNQIKIKNVLENDHLKVSDYGKLIQKNIADIVDIRANYEKRDRSERSFNFVKADEDHFSNELSKLWALASKNAGVLETCAMVKYEQHATVLHQVNQRSLK